MKTSSIKYHVDGSIELVDIDVEDPQAGEIQVEGAACGICSWDISTCKYGADFKYPAPPGHEGVGYVRKIGPQVTGFKEGDRVASGGFTKLRNFGAEKVYKIPESPLPDTHWIVEPAACVINGIDHCHLRPGDRVVLIGCGFMGLLFLQALQHSYADQLVALDIDQHRLDVASGLGVQELHLVTTENSEGLAKMLKARDIDVVIDTSGSQSGLDLAGNIVRRGGLINLFGWNKGHAVSFNGDQWHLGGFSVVNTSPASKLRDIFPPAIRLLQKGIFDLKPLVTHVVGIEEYPALMRRILAGDKSYIKGVVTL
ncbi:MAG: hypothetical protein EXR62_07550 [Chloroflexi bacterium]|nr:hypothetical protein [Chloroflexota bacterium]